MVSFFFFFFLLDRDHAVNVTKTHPRENPRVTAMEPPRGRKEEEGGRGRREGNTERGERGKGTAPWRLKAEDVGKV